MNNVLERFQRHTNPPPAVTGELAPGSLTYARELEVPFHGTIDGEIVRITQIGNIVGWSPSLYATDRYGNMSWVPQSVVLAADPFMFPIDPSARAFSRTTSEGSELGKLNRN